MSQRPKKRTLRLPKDVIAQYRNSGKEEAEIKAMISMFADILCDKKNGNSSNTRPEEGVTMGQWSVDYYDDGDEKCIQFLRNVGGDDKGSRDDDDEGEDADDMAEEEQEEEEEEDDDQKQETADEMAEKVTREEALAEEERARKTAKRREKKLRKKEKLKEEAALKAEHATAKKRSAKIQSWRSRVIAASQSNEGYKMRSLLSESPLEDNVDAHLESLLPHCNSSQEEASQLLAAFIVNQSCKVVFIPEKNGRNALHTACLNANFYFVKLVVQHQQQGGELDSLCHDSGWTPLHYSVASGSLEIMKLLLAAGANVKTCTKDSQTCRASDGKGITARELAEILVSGKQDDEIETQGEALQEAKERYVKTPEFLCVLQTMVEKLKDVETNGYAPLPFNVEGESTRPKSSTFSGEATKKRKKTNKKAASQLKREQAEASIPSNAASMEEPVEQKEDPLVVALLGMGFTSDQIHAAAKACGGMERATADDMVMWILGGGEESSSPSSAHMEEATSPKETDIRGDVKIATGSAPSEKPAALDLKRAQQENLEAVKREQEARAVAQRLAAKKEEQRRRNREWNTRAQARQQEDLDRRALQEAQRLAKERATGQQPIVTGGPAALVGLTVDVGSKTAKAAAPKAPTKILQRPSKPSLKSGPPADMIAPAKQTRRAQSAGAGRGLDELEPTSQFVSSGPSFSSGGSERQSVGGLQQIPVYAQRPSNVLPPDFNAAGTFLVVSGGSFNLARNDGAASNYEALSTPGEIRATAKAFVPTGFKSTPTPQQISTVTSAPASFSSGLGLPQATQSSALSNDDLLSSLLNASAVSGTGLPLGFERPATMTPSITQSPSTISSSVTGITATDEPTFNSMAGFDLDGLATRPLLLDALSRTPLSSGIESSNGIAGSNIWGSASLAPGPRLSSFSGFGIGEATPAQQVATTGGSAMENTDKDACEWNSAGFTQGGSLNGSIW